MVGEACRRADSLPSRPAVHPTPYEAPRRPSAVSFVCSPDVICAGATSWAKPVLGVGGRGPTLRSPTPIIYHLGQGAQVVSVDGHWLSKGLERLVEQRDRGAEVVAEGCGEPGVRVRRERRPGPVSKREPLQASLDHGARMHWPEAAEPNRSHWQSALLELRDQIG